MGTPVKNSGCGSTNVYGGFEQTLFLGCSIMSFDASIGWDEQQSEITVQLVKDTCEAPAGQPKKYYNTSLQKTDWTAADPGFFGLSYSIIGAPVYFRVGNFEYAGLVQSWEESHSESGNPTYNVKIVDPRAILDSGQVIINDYAGGVTNLYNVINAFGYAETWGVSCPSMYQSAPGVYKKYTGGSAGIDGIVFGSPAEFYGGADVNNNGMRWDQVINATRILLSSFPAKQNMWSPYGRLTFKSPAVYPSTGMGIIPPDDTINGLSTYYLDLSELPSAPNYWRFQGTNITLMELINQITDQSSYSYYIELITLAPGIVEAGVTKFIKVRTANRAASPALNSIDAYVGATGATRQVLDYRKGRELRNEKTASLVIGGYKQNVYQAEQSGDPEGDGQPVNPILDDMITPFFGVDPFTGNVNEISVDIQDLSGDDQSDDLNIRMFSVRLPTLELQQTLGNPIYNRSISSYLNVSEMEIVSALMSFDLWLGYASVNNTELYQALNVKIQGANNFKHLVKFINILKNKLDANQLAPKDVVAVRNNVAPPKENIKEAEEYDILLAAHAWLRKWADTYYGKQYQVRVPFTCGRVDSESTQILLSEQPNDGGWTEVSTIIDIPNDSVYSEFFSLPDGRLGNFARFPGYARSDNMSNDSILTYGNKYFVSVDVEDSYVFLDKNTLFSPRVVIKLQDRVYQINNDNDIGLPEIQKGLAMVVKLLKKELDKQPKKKGDVDEDGVKKMVTQLNKRVGAIYTHMAFRFMAVLPEACALGLKSNIMTYGPWGASGVPGATEVVQDDGLVPWEYGSFSVMNLAGQTIANANISNMQTSESGSITIAGFPDLPLGAELLSADSGNPFYNATGKNLVENRIANTGSYNGETYYYAPILPWDGTYGPNVTGITVRVGDSGAQTTYNIKTWTPKWGRFFKRNADRLKAIGKQSLEFRKRIRGFVGKAAQVSRVLGISGESVKRGVLGVELDEQFWGKPKSPHHIFVADIGKWNDGSYSRTDVSSMNMTELGLEIESSYDTKAIMSLDGLLRPVSMDGDGGLPRYTQPIDANGGPSLGFSTHPPVDLVGQEGQLNQLNTIVNIDYLNPLSNPSSMARSDVLGYSDTSTVGHDVEILGRNANPPASSMVLPIEGLNPNGTDTSNNDYADDYRLLSLRGPLLMQGWGYDLNGFPIPNKVDDTGNIINNGQYESTGLQKKFLDNWLRQSKTWPVGPIDLRWDRERSVWTVPQYRTVVAQLDSNISPFSSGNAVVQNNQPLYDTAGNTISTPKIVVYDKVGSTYTAGDYVIAAFDNYEKKYRIIEYKGQDESGIQVMDTDDCCGIGSRVSSLTPADLLIFGAGIRAYDTTGCPSSFTPPPGSKSVVLNAGISTSSSTLCLNTNGSSPGNGLFNKIQFAKGLKVAQTGGDCEIIVGGGMSLSSTSACRDLSAGGPNTSYLYNEFELGPGLKAFHVSDCVAAMQAGIQFFNTTGCVTATSSTNNFKNSIYLADGLFAQDTPGDNCAMTIGAGVNFYYDQNLCVSSVPDSTKNINKIKLGKGLWANHPYGEACNIELGAGFGISFSDVCVSGSQVSPGPFNTLLAGGGLEIRQSATDSCMAEIGLYFPVDGTKVNQIEIGDCLKFVRTTGCSGKLTFRDVYTTGLTVGAIEIPVITSLSTECCSTGGGIKSITYGFTTLRFNSCGQLINSDTIDTNTLTCDC